MNLNKKSQLVSFILTLLFGPIGLLYSTIAGSIGFMLIAFLTAPTVIGPIICWILSILVGAHYVSSHNHNVDVLSSKFSNKNDFQS